MAKGDSLFPYVPKTSLLYVALVLFAIPTICQIYLIFRYKNKYYITFIIGCVCEVAGYGARRASINTPTILGPYIAQELLLLLPPVFYSATIYMTLKKVIITTGGDHLSRVALKRLTTIFVTADCVSLFVQASGGGLIGSDKHDLQSVGKWVIIVGLAIQILAFAGFLFLTWDYQKILNRTTSSTSVASRFSWKEEWRLCVYGIYAAGLLIMVRSVYRVVDFAGGRTGYVATHEVLFYAFDALMMLQVSILGCLIYPPRLLESQDYVVLDREKDISLVGSPSSDETAARRNTRGAGRETSHV